MWVHGGDYSPPDRTLIEALAQGINSVEGEWLNTFHGARDTTVLTYFGGKPSWLQVNVIYTRQDNVRSTAQEQFAHSPLPFFLIESIYEGEKTDAEGARNQAYQALLGGATGQVFGNYPVWSFADHWQHGLDSAGAWNMSHLRALFEQLPWTELQPDVDGTLLVSAPDAKQPVTTVAMTADRTLALVYVQALQPITVNLDRMKGPTVAIRWFDPVTGTFRNMSGPPVAAAGHQPLAAPRAAGGNDWLVVLETAR